MVYREAKIEDFFLFKSVQKIIEENIACRDSKRKKEAFCNDDWDKRIPHGGWKGECPNPSCSAYCVGRKRGSKRAREQKSIAQEVAHERNSPEQRKVPNLAADWVSHKRNDRDDGNYKPQSGFSRKIQHCKKHGEEANNSAYVLNMCAVHQKIKELHKQHCDYSRNVADKSASEGSESVIHGEFCL